MSREKRRAGRKGARSRRTPARAAGGGPRIPWVPVGVVVGIAAVVGIIALVVWQQGGEEAERQFPEAARIEADPAPDLPGEWVNLEEIYGAPYPETSDHVIRDVDFSEQGLPPAGGPHWGNGDCEEKPEDAHPFCGPVPWGIYREPWEAASLVHNLEHAGIVVWYNTTDESLRDEMEDLIEDRPDELLVMVPYRDMEEEHVALTAWARRDKFPVSEYSRERVDEFLDAFRCRFDPEGIC